MVVPSGLGLVPDRAACDADIFSADGGVMKKAKQEVKEIKIEKGIPVPPKGAANKKYPFSEMEVGDSFFAPNIRQALVTGSFGPHEAKGWKFTCRTIKDEAGVLQGVRVWRIK